GHDLAFADGHVRGPVVALDAEDAADSAFHGELEEGAEIAPFEVDARRCPEEGAAAELLDDAELDRLESDARRVGPVALHLARPADAHARAPERRSELDA